MARIPTQIGISITTERRAEHAAHVLVLVGATHVQLTDLKVYEFTSLAATLRQEEHLKSD